jgi:hypothetical protein
MIIDVKHGARLKQINDPFLTVARIAFELWQEEGLIPCVTSGSDGNHLSESYHWQGLAWDWRIWHLIDPWKTAARLQVKLREIDPAYDVVFGDAGHKDHIHTEYDLKKKGGD